MSKYLEQLNDEIKEYFKILSPTFPSFLEDYINTKEMQRIGKISMNCGTDYSNFFDIKYFYSNLDHSVGVALIIWNFTHDKKQTLAGLFHDISTPVFKHCIDFMNGDSLTQESTEEKTYEIIKNSKEIMELLSKDNILLEEVSDYKIYPIADNSSPKLSADRFEYNFSSGLEFYRIWSLEEIRKVYENVTVSKNEDGINELVFKNKKICENYIKKVSKLWPKWICNEDKTVMQFIADMCKSMNKINKLSIDDLYTLSEEEVINKFKNDSDEYLSRVWNDFISCYNCYTTDKYVLDKYCTKMDVKKRYLNPLVLVNDKTQRIYDISLDSKKRIDEYLNTKNNDYVCLDFEFKPYK